MRRTVAAVVLVLAGCASPVGAERPICDAEWLDVPTMAAEAGGVREEVVAIDCFEPIGPQRVRVGFTLPPGPDCFVLQRVELRESADAISITLLRAVNDDPNAGACSEEARMAMTEIDLASPVDDRALLDGSARD
jgi:hypothetical protein